MFWELDDYEVGTRVAVTTYYRDDSGTMMALPGETGVIADKMQRDPVVVFDRTGYRATVSRAHIMVPYHGDLVVVRPL